MNFITILTPNGIKSTDKLNHASSKLKSSNFYKFVNKDKTGFELDFDARWAWIIKFNNKSGFMALKEQNDGIQVWVYKYDNDINPKEYLLRNFNRSETNKLINFIKENYRRHIQ